MTPMVDLGFLLITFFVFTSELRRPNTLDLVMPKEGKDMPVAESLSLTILLGNEGQVYYYEGEWSLKKVHKASFHVANGIGRVIREKQQLLDLHPVRGEGRNGLMLVIKPGPGTNYKHIIDAMDEVLINGVKKYAITRPGKEENLYLESR
jgi:biopolymer transport protein ExbD